MSTDHIDWQRLVRDIHDTGMTFEAIGMEAGYTSHATVVGYATGRWKAPRSAQDPKANALIRLHMERCPELEFPRT